MFKVKVGLCKGPFFFSKAIMLFIIRLRNILVKRRCHLYISPFNDKQN